MPKADSCRQRYALVAILGAIGGGLAVALATEAIPRIMSRMMTNMMSQMPQKMMASMKEEGINPADIGQRMMAGFGEAPEMEAPQSTGQTSGGNGDPCIHPGSPDYLGECGPVCIGEARWQVGNGDTLFCLAF